MCPSTISPYAVLTGVGRRMGSDAWCSSDHVLREPYPEPSAHHPSPTARPRRGAPPSSSSTAAILHAADVRMKARVWAALLDDLLSRCSHTSCPSAYTPSPAAGALCSATQPSSRPGCCALVIPWPLPPHLLERLPAVVQCA
ncbi:hypothetical protein BRADI_3g22692v3 [Brachypodium distachyon]|uniref:Uncharacterized protein n=1 Tax=Brachypodium distachyon TaxID=15368 RepID=A0A0Q3JDI1_BRADI|nr:hypothetical protein BRADI_3g22692v3 [Brachypodium distachyon]